MTRNTAMTSFLGRVGAAPISWGICEAPGWGPQLPVDRVLGEARDLGIRAFEQGAIGWLPDDPGELRAKLDEYGMRLLGGFVPLVLHNPGQRAAAFAHAHEVAANMAAAGGTYFVTAPVPSLEHWHRPNLDAAELDELFTNLDRLTELLAEYGLVQAVHPHLDTDIETGDDFHRFLNGCDAGFTFDTGHLSIGGADVLEIARKHRQRVALVHLKDVDRAVAERQRSGELTLFEATRDGMFPSLGDGYVELATIIDELERGGYDGWYIMETDVALTSGLPAPGDGPVRSVARSLDFLRSLHTSMADR